MSRDEINIKTEPKAPKSALCVVQKQFHMELAQLLEDPEQYQAITFELNVAMGTVVRKGTCDSLGTYVSRDFQDVPAFARGQHVMPCSALRNLMRVGEFENMSLTGSCEGLTALEVMEMALEACDVFSLSSEAHAKMSFVPVELFAESCWTQFSVHSTDPDGVNNVLLDDLQAEIEAGTLATFKRKGDESGEVLISVSAIEEFCRRHATCAKSADEKGRIGIATQIAYETLERMPLQDYHLDELLLINKDLGVPVNAFLQALDEAVWDAVLASSTTVFEADEGNDFHFDPASELSGHFAWYGRQHDMAEMFASTNACALHLRQMCAEIKKELVSSVTTDRIPVFADHCQTSAMSRVVKSSEILQIVQRIESQRSLPRADLPRMDKIVLAAIKNTPAQDKKPAIGFSAAAAFSRCRHQPPRITPAALRSLKPPSA